MWYAVQKSREDDWSVGSFNFDEAASMLMKQGYGLIAVIENDVCIMEMEYEEVLR